MSLSRSGFELNEIWAKQAELVESDARLRSLERAASTGDKDAAVAHAKARLRAGHDPTEVGAAAHRAGVHDRVRENVPEDKRYHFDLGRYALDYARHSFRWAEASGPSIPVAPRDRPPRSRPSKKMREAYDKSFLHFHDHVQDGALRDHHNPNANYNTAGIASMVRRRKLDAIKKSGAHPHEALSATQRMMGGGHPARDGDKFRYPITHRDPENWETKRRMDNIKSVLPKAKISFSSDPHPMFGWEQHFMHVDVGAHTKKG